MERILVAGEFNGECKKVIQKALEVANKSDFIYILIFIPPKVYGIIDKKAYAMLKKKAKQQLQSFIDDVLQQKLSCKGAVKKGDIVSLISKSARKYKSTLILVGYAEGGLFSRYSTEELIKKIADTTAVPVMVVR
jgi:K+-sensing histidine kinase KdpD